LPGIAREGTARRVARALSGPNPAVQQACGDRTSDIIRWFDDPARQSLAIQCGRVLVFDMHYYTSITSNYLPKARVLAESIRRHDREAHIHILLSDVPPPGLSVAEEPFDSVLLPHELDIPDVDAWLFKHTLVEMCTAVKGPGALEIIRRHQPEKLVYFDPDIVVFGGLDVLSTELDRHQILLTPHLTMPEPTRSGVLDNEIAALKHGIYNLGFIGVRCSGEGLRGLRWWAARLLEHCRDDIPGGLFTDQRWADFFPAMFDGVKILRDPQYNVATWNLSNRVASGKAPDALQINGQPLAFYHFSGFDSGAQKTMLGLYGRDSPALFDLRKWYIAQCDAQGQQEMGLLPCVYATFCNGEPISKAHRILYRERKDLQKAFPQPFETSDVNRSYYHWYAANHAAEESAGRIPAEASSDRMAALERELSLIKRSRSWRLARAVSRFARAFR